MYVTLCDRIQQHTQPTTKLPRSPPAHQPEPPLVPAGRPYVYFINRLSSSTESPDCLRILWSNPFPRVLVCNGTVVRLPLACRRSIWLPTVFTFTNPCFFSARSTSLGRTLPSLLIGRQGDIFWELLPWSQQRRQFHRYCPVRALARHRQSMLRSGTQ